MIVKRPECDKLTGFYLGTVLWHLPHGKLKVFIHGVYNEDFFEKPSALPTAVQMTPLFAGNSNGDGCFSYPNIGATVVCSFLNGDQNFPIVLGAMQGGPNAYNQYNYVKNLGELSADRHMITTGNAHIRMHDDGQVNILLQRPFDNEASVDFYNAEKTANDILLYGYTSAYNTKTYEKFGITEPVKDQIDSLQTSSLNCRFSMTDIYNYGGLSASQHYYNFGGNTSYWQPVITSSLAMSSFDSQTIYDLRRQEYNNELYGTILSSSDVYQSSFNSVDYWTDTVYQEKYKLDLKQNAGQYQILSNETRIYNQNDLVSSYSLLDTAESVYQYSEVLKHDSNWMDMSVGIGNSFGSYRELKSTDKNGMFERKNKLTAISKLDMPLGQILQEATYKNYIDKNDSYDIYDNTYCKNIDLSNHCAVNTVLHGHCEEYSSVKYKVTCQESMDAENGEIEIFIQNNENLCSCRIMLNKSGIAEIEASDELFIKSKKISITGNDISINGKTVNIDGANGDCSINNVSLLNHVHMETQSGDVVSPQKTQSAIASN